MNLPFKPIAEYDFYESGDGSAVRTMHHAYGSMSHFSSFARSREWTNELTQIIR